jgi:hypothetical protein
VKGREERVLADWYGDGFEDRLCRRSREKPGSRLVWDGLGDIEGEEEKKNIMDGR